jgi:prolyl 4-hydroxylase
MIIEYPNFLTQSECLTLIGIGESDQLKVGKTATNKYGYRKARVRWIREDELVDKIKSEVSKLSGLPIDNQEDFHFVKYSEGGEYKPHYDGYDRSKTALIYLNDGFKGGETFFNNVNKIVKPEVGKLIIWDNLNPDGTKDKDSLHTGLPVEFGTKYIAVIWIKK